MLTKSSKICRASSKECKTVDKLVATLLENKNIHISNLTSFKNVLQSFREDGISKIQVVSDFDQTLSAYSDCQGGKLQNSYSCLFDYKDSVYHLRQKDRELSKKFEWIEFDTRLSHEEKVPHMIEWWKQANDIIIKSGFTREIVNEAAMSSAISLRLGFKELIGQFISYDIPIVVASAGIGDVINAKLKQEFGSLIENFKVFSNYFVFDQQDVIMDMSTPMVHSHNKHIFFDIGKTHFNLHQNRHNFILFGDSVADVDTISRIPFIQNSLKIGFVNFNVEDHLKKYLEKFDIILADPCSLHPLLLLFEYLLESNND